MSAGDLSHRPGVCNTTLPSPPGRHILDPIQLCRDTPFSLRNAGTEGLKLTITEQTQNCILTIPLQVGMIESGDDIQFTLTAI